MSERAPESAVSPDAKSKCVFLVLALLLFAAFAFQLYYFAVRTSATVDEPAHILAGHRHWQCGDFGINPEQPPMLKMLAAAPIEFRPLTDLPWECGSRLTSKNDLILYGTKFVIQNGVDSVVIPARLAAALFAVALAILVFAAAWKMFGRWETLAALAILANRYEDAIKDASEAIEQAPEDARPHVALGLALLRAGQKEAALRALEKADAALKSNPVLLRAPENRALQELKRSPGN